MIICLTGGLGVIHACSLLQTEISKCLIVIDVFTCVYVCMYVLALHVAKLTVHYRATHFMWGERCSYMKLIFTDQDHY